MLIGGITNGNGDPRKVNRLKDLFDFNVSAEDVGEKIKNAKSIRIRVGILQITNRALQVTANHTQKYS